MKANRGYIQTATGYINSSQSDQGRLDVRSDVLSSAVRRKLDVHQYAEFHRI